MWSKSLFTRVLILDFRDIGKRIVLRFTLVNLTAREAAANNGSSSASADRCRRFPPFLLWLLLPLAVLAKSVASATFVRKDMIRALVLREEATEAMNRLVFFV